MFIVFGCLVAVLIGVVWILPDYIDEVSLSDATTTIIENTPAPPTETQVQLARQKREAERALGEFLHRQAMLEGQEVATWGGEDYEQTLATLAEADAAFANGDFTLANTKYITATSMLNGLESSKAQRLQKALTAGGRALSAYDAAEAKKQYEIALALEPQNQQALIGSKRAANIERLAELLGEAKQLEESEDWAAALRVYESAVSLDPQSIEAQEGLNKVATEIETQRFHGAMSEALSAIQRGKFDVAREALSEATKLKPKSSDVVDAQKRLQLAVQQHRISTHRENAKTFEDAERWHEAAKEFEAVLVIDPQAQFASRGLSQSLQLARLHDQLDSYIRHPERLQSEEPRSNARALVDVLASMQETGPILDEKYRQLVTILELAETPVNVVLHSDEMTEVSIDRVGSFGRFKESTVTLLPGTYVARGTRVGYRDVLLEFSITIGASELAVTIQCEEKI
ncbi:MAG: tetratricopeptide repeat protein [Arenicellales bacterium]|nr:tetratricopeptide repeat protein [Arenicellales bacterium]